jgi:hypothetical protein
MAGRGVGGIDLMAPGGLEGRAQQAPMVGVTVPVGSTDIDALGTRPTS